MMAPFYLIPNPRNTHLAAGNLIIVFLLPARTVGTANYFDFARLSEDEMRRPTPPIRSTLWVCKHYTGSNVQEGGSAHHGC